MVGMLANPQLASDLPMARRLTFAASLLVTLADASYDGPWRSSFESCWRQNITASDDGCNRVMTISHGGDWDLASPYDSLDAFKRAASKGADVVKGDFRVNADNVGMVMHRYALALLYVQSSSHARSRM